MSRDGPMPYMILRSGMIDESEWMVSFVSRLLDINARAGYLWDPNLNGGMGGEIFHMAGWADE